MSENPGILTPDRIRGLKDNFVNRFADGLRDGKVTSKAGYPDDIFHPAWSVPTVDTEAMEDYIARDIMESPDTESHPLVREWCMPNVVNDEVLSPHICTLTAMAAAFGFIELYNVTVSAIVTTSVRINDFRWQWPAASNVWRQGSTEDAESRGVFGSILTAEVYARNGLHWISPPDPVWLLACPNAAYPHGLCINIKVVTA